MSSFSPSKPPSLPVTPDQRGHWLLPPTVQPQDIDGLANFAQAVTHPPTFGCWGRACCECPFNSVDETPEEWEERVFKCLWGQISADMSPGSDKDLSSHDFLPDSGFSSAVTYNDEAYEDGEIYEEDSSEADVGAGAYDEACDDGYEEIDEAGGPHEEDLDSWAKTEAGRDDEAFVAKGKSNETSGPSRWECESDYYVSDSDDVGLSGWASDGSDEESEPSNPPKQETVEPEASIDENQLTNIAYGLFRGSYERAVDYVKKERRRVRNETACSHTNSNMRNLGGRPSVRPSNQARRLEEPTPATQSSMRALQGSSRGMLSTSNPSSTHKTVSSTCKRKRTPELEEDLDNEDDYKPASKEGKGKFASFARSPPENFSKTNSGLGTEVPKKKARQTPATPQDTAERIPRSTWPKSEGDALNRLLRARRDFERTNNITPLRDEKLFGLLSEQLNQVTRREKPRTKNACKNFWNRYGRHYYDCDERGDTKRSNSKVTSAQSTTKMRKAKQQTKTISKTKQNGMQQANEDEDEDEDEE
ncbi:hypothetical protein N431DRAFT_326948 [Stipitochalara longipes BDJ]|nr:hypothetical protein N431DRAFT_326948 [Stipitochalara longipes BDJ]